jgi:collagen type VII alpha
MGQLTNLYVSESYQGLLKMTNSTTGVTGTLQTVQTGDGTNTPLQISQTQVNISGSLTINGSPITGSAIDTGSFATTGSNTFIGAQIIEGNVTFPSNSFVSTDNTSGSLYLSSLNQGTLYLNADGGEGDVIVGYSAWQNSLKVKGGTTEITGSLGVTNIKGTGSLFLQPNQTDARYLEVYNTSPTDTHITASGGQIFLGDDVTYVKVDNYGTVKRIDIVAENDVNVSGSMSVTGSIDITGQYLVNGVAFSGGTSGTSGTSGDSGSSGTSGTSGQDGSSGTSGTSGGTGSSGTSGTSGVAGSSGTSGTDGSSGTSGVSPSLVGVITTGSITTTQVITGSLILGNTVISGSLIGGTDNNGIIKIQSQLNTSSSAAIPFGYISSSNPDLQTNIITSVNTTSFGSGLLTANQTGSIVISGSNNIILGGSNRNNTLVTQGTYGYLGGGGNIGTVYPTLGTGSILRPTINNNALQSALSLQFTTSSLAAPAISSNLIYGSTTINHQSGSVLFQLNHVGGQGFTSNANTTTLGLNPNISFNTFVGNTNPHVTLNHNSSSIVYQGNIGGGLTVTNNYSSSVSTAVNNIAVTSNLLVGESNTLVVSGSNSGTRRTFNSNLILGRSNIINSNFSGGTGGHLVSTALLGQDLIVSASSTAPTQGGTVYVGRFNATGSLQEDANQAIFVVGNGTGAGARSNAIHIESTGNNRMTGSLKVSGSNHQIVGNTVITGSINTSSSTFVILSGSMRMSNESGSVRIADGNNQAQLFFNPTRKVGFFLGQGNMDQTDTQFGITSDSTDNYTMGGNFNNFRSGSNNLMLGIGTISIRSGSNNVILAKATSYTTGSNNLILGSGPSGIDEVQDYFNVQLPGGITPIMFKSGSSPLTVTGSLKVTGDVQFASGSNKTMGTFVLNGGNPGTATVSNTLVTANSLIFLTKQTNTNSGNGTVSVTSKGSNTFSVTSDHNGDADTVAYLIINPA